MTTTPLLQIIDISKAFLNKIFSPEEVKLIAPVRAALSLCSVMKLPVCTNCHGRGVKAHRRCRICNGYGFTSHIDVASLNITEAEEKIINRFKLLMKNAGKRDEKVQNAKMSLQKLIEDNQARSLVNLTEDQKQKFLKTLYQTPSDQFLTSVKQQFEKSGKISEKQVSAILSRHERDKRLRAEQLFFIDYTVNDTITETVKFVSIKQIELETFQGYQPNTIDGFEISFQNHRHQIFKIKTTSVKLADKITNLADKWLLITGTVGWISSNKKYLSMSSRGFKVVDKQSVN